MALVTSGLLAQYKMSDSSGTTLTDTSGNANHGTAGFTIVQDGGGVLSQTPQYVSLPAGVVGTWKSMCIFADFDPVEFKGGNTYLWSSHTPNTLLGSIGVDNTFQNSMTNSGIVNSGDSVITCPTSSMPLMGMVTVIPSDHTGGTDVIYHNDQVATYLPSSAYGTGLISSTGGADSSANWVGNSALFLFGDSGANRMYGRIYYALVYNRALSAQEVADNYNFVLSELATRGVTIRTKQQTPFNNLVGIGDSIVAGFGTTANNYKESFLNQMTLKGEWKRINLGVGSITIYQWQQMLNTCRSAMSQTGVNAAIVELGINDFNVNGSLTTAQGHQRLVDFCTSLRAMGYYVIVTTMTSWPGEATCKSGFNTLIRANWTTYADALADLGADAHIGADNQYLDTNYFGFGNAHYNTAAHLVAAGIISPYVDTAYSGPRLQVVNPDFELNYLASTASTQATIPGWTMNGTAIGKFIFVSGSNYLYSGGGHQYAFLPAVGDYVEQTLGDTFTTDSTYTITVNFASGNSSTTKAKVELFGSGAALATSQVTSGTTGHAFPFSSTITYRAAVADAGQNPKIRISCDTGSAANALYVKRVRVQKDLPITTTEQRLRNQRWRVQ